MKVIEAKKMTRRNWRRRSLGIALAGAPFVLLCCSLWIGIGRGDFGPAASLAMLPALGFGLLNFSLSFIRPWLYRRRHAGMDGYRYVSGLPVLGTLLLLVGVALSFGSVSAAIVGLIACAIDTGGLSWFVLATWKDETLWDAQT